MAYCALFIAMLRPLHSITNKEQYQKLKIHSIQRIWVENMHCLTEAISHYRESTHLVLSAKRTGTQWRTKVSLWCMHCTACSWRKGTSQHEAMSNSEEIKSVATSIAELCLAEGSEWVSEGVSQHKIPLSILGIMKNRAFTAQTKYHLKTSFNLLC